MNISELEKEKLELLFNLSQNLTKIDSKDLSIVLQHLAKHYSSVSKMLGEQEKTTMSRFLYSELEKSLSTVSLQLNTLDNNLARERITSQEEKRKQHLDWLKKMKG